MTDLRRTRIYDEPMNLPLRTMIILLLVGLAGAAAYGLGRLLAPGPDWAGTVLQEPQPTGDLVLTAADGTRTTLADFAGEADWTLVFFGFVDCPDVCPLTLSRLAETYQDLGEPGEVRVAMITVDPERDAPERLERYVDGFHPDIHGLGGTSEDVALAARRFFIGYSATEDGMIHTEAVALLDSNARMRAVYTQGNVPRIGGDVSSLLAGRRF